MKSRYRLPFELVGVREYFEAHVRELQKFTNTFWWRTEITQNAAKAKKSELFGQFTEPNLGRADPDWIQADY